MESSQVTKAGKERRRERKKKEKERVGTRKD